MTKRMLNPRLLLQQPCYAIVGEATPIKSFVELLLSVATIIDDLLRSQRYVAQGYGETMTPFMRSAFEILREEVVAMSAAFEITLVTFVVPETEKFCSGMSIKKCVNFSHGLDG